MPYEIHISHHPSNSPEAIMSTLAQVGHSASNLLSNRDSPIAPEILAALESSSSVYSSRSSSPTRPAKPTAALAPTSASAASTEYEKMVQAKDAKAKEESRAFIDAFADKQVDEFGNKLGLVDVRGEWYLQLKKDFVARQAEQKKKGDALKAASGGEPVVQKRCKRDFLIPKRFRKRL